MDFDIHNLPLEDATSMSAVFGNPDSNHNGTPSPHWEAANIVRLVPPYPMKFSWGPAVSALRVHRFIRDPLMEALQDIQKLFGDQKSIERYNMHLTGGAYMFRLMRGSHSRLSVHSWGAAIDMDPQHNPFPHQWVPDHGMVRPDVVAIFEKHGAHWRGKNGDNDPMHFQWCRHHPNY